MKRTFAIAALILCGFALLFARDEGLPCPFCQPDVIDKQAFYRGIEVLGIATHKPAVEGHVLIIPERHVVRFEDLTPSEFSEMGEAIKKVNEAVRRLCGTTGYLLLQKNGGEAGQSVPHVHFHYIPCSKGASKALLALKILLAPWSKPLSAEQMAPFIADLQSEMSSASMMESL